MFKAIFLLLTLALTHCAADVISEGKRQLDNGSSVNSQPDILGLNGSSSRKYVWRPRRPPPPKRRYKRKKPPPPKAAIVARPKSPPPPRRSPPPPRPPPRSPPPRPPPPFPSPPPPSPPPPPPPAPQKCPDDSWSLLFEDEFNFFDTSKWDYQQYDGWQYNVGDWGNNELQFYTNSSNNVYTSDGNLVINARLEPDPSGIWETCWQECRERCASLGYVPGTNEYGWCVEPCGYPRCDIVKSRSITSGRIRTYKKFAIGPNESMKTIRIEVKAKYPVGTGLWGAAWMLPEEGATDNCTGCSNLGGPGSKWPTGGELDISEAVNNMSTIVGTVHYGSEGAPNYQSHYASAAADADGWQTFAVEWQATTIKWFLNGVQYGVSNSKASGDLNGWFSGPLPGTNAPFDRQFHLLLNLAVGGNMPAGAYRDTHGGAEMTVDMVKDTLRSGDKQMKVDFVRVCGKGS